MTGSVTGPDTGPETGPETGKDPGGDRAAEAALFAALSAAFPPGATVAVAVSGGGDSMALLALLAELPGRRLQAVTVNHGLRPEAEAEAALVARFCAGRGIGHTVLRWDHGGAPKGNLMQAARLARLSLIGDWARGQGIAQIALAHTAQDQAETVLMGLSRAAGLDGLSGMRPRWQENGVTWQRPLLAFSREDLRHVLTVRGIAWAEDPTNANSHFLRARARNALQPLAGLGISAATLAQSAAALAQSRAALDRMADAAASQLITERAGALRFDPAPLAQTDPEILRRLVLRAILWLTLARHAPRALSVQRLVVALQLGQAATLAGVRLVPARSGLWLCREARMLGPAVGPGALWDGRWRVQGPFADGDQVAAPGPKALAAVADWRAAGLPRAVLLATPAIWRQGRLIALPVVQNSPDWRAEVVLSYNAFNIAH